MRIWIAFAALLALPSPAAAKAREVKDVITLAGKKTERWRGFHANGKRWYVHYWRNDKKVGTHRDYDAAGTLTQELTYRRDILHGPFKTWHANGKLASRGRHRDGAQSGLIEHFHLDGTPAETRSFRDTLPDGAYQAWHPNGQRAIEGAYAKGEPIGTWKRWTADGALAETRRFDGGRWVEPAHPLRAVGGDQDAPDFRLFLVTGGHFEGFDFQVWLHPNGWVDWVHLRHVPRVAKKRDGGLRKGELYYGIRAWHRRLRLTDADWIALKQQLAALKPWDLPAQTINRNVHDGSQWYVGIRANGRTHRAYFSNRFSPEIKTFAQWLRTRLASDTYRLDRLTGRPDAQRTWRRTFDFEP